MKKQIRLNLNENNLMYNQQHMHHKYNHKEMCYYSSKNCLRIINDISNYYGVNKEYVFSFNGLDESILVLSLFCALHKKGTIFTTENTYNTINYSAELLSLDLLSLPLLKNQINIHSVCEYILKHIDNGGCVSMIYICNPHNPTGSLFDGDINELLVLAKSYNFLVFIDEAYAEYNSSIYSQDVSVRVQNSQIVIGRTFSKLYGLAGLRIGYIITSNPRLRKWLGEYNKTLLYKENRHSANVVHSILSTKKWVEKIRNKTSKLKENLIIVLLKYDIEYFDSSTNFILIRPVCKSKLLVEYARDCFNIDLMDASEFGWPGYVRITVGTKRSIQLIEKLFKKLRQEGLL